MYISCSNEESYSPLQINFTTIAKNYLQVSNVIDIDKSNLIINNQEEWDALKTKMDALNPVSERFEESDLNFETEMVIAVISEIKTTVYSVEIDSIIDRQSEIVIYSHESGTMLLAMSQPYHIVRMPRTMKQITFIE